MQINTNSRLSRRQDVPRNLHTKIPFARRLIGDPRWEINGLRSAVAGPPSPYWTPVVVESYPHHHSVILYFWPATVIACRICQLIFACSELSLILPFVLATLMRPTPMTHLMLPPLGSAVGNSWDKLLIRKHYGDHTNSRHETGCGCTCDQSRYFNLLPF